ncbi:MAG: hypothetical protein H6712_00740 [Myxococcales bacterium]|nr:hypothetical protein [Myxococcales bacterium]
MDPDQLERFALADDRRQALEQLVPGTEDYYFHLCLVHEQAGDFAAVERTLDAWIDRMGVMPRVEQIRHRLALLRFSEQPASSLEYLRRALGLRFDHQPAALGRPTEHPHALDPRVLSWEAVHRHGMAHSRAGDLAGFTDQALRALAHEPMEGERLRHYLGRIARPDHPGLVERILAELDDRRSGGFGALPIHARLLTAQLEELAARRPRLWNDDAFVDAMLIRQQPGPDVEWEHDLDEHEAFLRRLWEIAGRLGPGHGPLKAHVLHHRLLLDRRRGIYERARFLEYLALPRQVAYANLEALERVEHAFALGRDFRGVTLHPRFYDDQALVEDFLAHLLLEHDDPTPFEPYLERAFLDRVRATAMILAGVGDIERWTSLLDDPARFAELKDRVELSFAPQCPTSFSADDEVSLTLDVKNVSTLVVKVFEINTLSYFLVEGSEVDTSIDLDGLVASEEHTHEYDVPPLRRVRRTFDFPALRRPGVYVVELIGGGISSRALVRKGRLRMLERVGAAGHVLTVLDEQQRPLPDATLWLGGREYRPDEDGTILVPFSTRPRRQTILLRHDGLTTLETFEHQAEHYELSADFYVERESLLRGARATVLVRARLEVGGRPVSLSLLERPTLVVRSVDHEGAKARVERPDFPLHADRESTHELQVPPGLASLTITLRGEVRTMASGRAEPRSSSRTFQLNGIDREPAIESIHLAQTRAGHVAYLLGRSGEPRGGTVLRLRLHHRALTQPIDAIVQTDDHGRVELGPLREVSSVELLTPSGARRQWSPTLDRAERPRAIHAGEGETIRIPVMGHRRLGEQAGVDETDEPEARVSLLERRGSAFTRDLIAATRIHGGFLEISGLGAGDYDLRLDDEPSIPLRISEGPTHGQWIAGPVRQLERITPGPLQIQAATETETHLELRVHPVRSSTRVHVFGTRFLPEHEAFAGRPPSPRVVRLAVAPSAYVSERDIGDEYRYILERRRAAITAGTMLARPGLLLAPWAVQSTETRTQGAAEGQAWAASPRPAPRAASAYHAPPGAPSATDESGRANLDFLAHPAAVLLDLRPDAHGVVRVPKEAVQHANQLRVVAVDAHHAVQRLVLRPEVHTPHRDVRLRLGLDPAAHYTKQKTVVLRTAGEPLTIADITTSTFEVYDTLERVFDLFAALTNDATLETFRWVLRWPTADEAQRRAWYSEHACHELNLWLSRKDPEFFARVVVPHLRNKRHKTFLDRYLLEEELSEYRRPWAHGRLNVVERILLAQRGGGDELESCARHVGELDDLRPSDTEEQERRFRVALGSAGLRGEDRFGLAAAAEQAEQARIAVSLAAPAAALTAVGGVARTGGGRADAAKKKGARSMVRSREESKSELAEEPEMLDDYELDDDELDHEGADGFGGAVPADLARRERAPRLFVAPDRTKEWAENDYYRRPLHEQGPELVVANPLWRDLAAHRHGPFLSTHLPHATGSFTEMMLALSVLDLPMAAEAPEIVVEDATMTLRGGSDAVVFLERIEPADPPPEAASILVAQHYLRHDDRYLYEGNEVRDKVVSGELLTGVVYTGKVVLTNPSSARAKLEVLLQIPVGSVPVAGGTRTRGHTVELPPQGTHALEYSFYFPRPGVFDHFPVHVAEDGRLVAAAAARPLSVVREPSEIDRSTWAWVANQGSDDEVLAWMDAHNLERLGTQPAVPGLSTCAWRMKERSFYDRCLALLSRRRVYDRVLWSYSLHHADLPNLRELLLHEESFLDRCGLELDSPLVRIDPIARRRYQHLEYAPLINARAHRLGARREILNQRLAVQYRLTLERLSLRPRLDDDDRLAITYYLLLQDRVDEGLAMLERVDPDAVTTRIQLDYLQVVACFLRQQPQAAREIAERYRDYPVDRWRTPFLDALAQLDELEGGEARVIDPEDRDQQQARLADAEPDLDLRVENGAIEITHRNLRSVVVNVYRMDIELLFSRQPFVQQQSERFSFVRPNESWELPLAADREHTTVPLPEAVRGANVVVELVAAGRRRSQAYFAHQLVVQLSEGHGQLRVARQSGGPVPRAYVKVYARLQGGAVELYRDGYTDLRGRFDYASTSSDMLDRVERFAILVMSPQDGALVREAAPPVR